MQFYNRFYPGYQNSTDKDAYLRTHESKMILFEAARESMSSIISKPTSDSISTLENKIQKLTLESEKLMAVLVEHKRKVSEVNQLKSNLETYLKTPYQTTQSQLDLDNH